MLLGREEGGVWCGQGEMESVREGGSQSGREGVSQGGRESVREGGSECFGQKGGGRWYVDERS